jgi:Flp pilus assembly pilin Flp
MYSIGIISGWYNERLIAYILYGLLFNFIGVSLIATIVLLTRHVQFKKLNNDLEKYKKQLYNVSFKEDNKEEANDEEN